VSATLVENGGVWRAILKPVIGEGGATQWQGGILGSKDLLDRVKPCRGHEIVPRLRAMDSVVKQSGFDRKAVSLNKPAIDIHEMNFLSISLVVENHVLEGAVIGDDLTAIGLIVDWDDFRHEGMSIWPKRHDLGQHLVHESGCQCHSTLRNIVGSRMQQDDVRENRIAHAGGTREPKAAVVCPHRRGRVGVEVGVEVVGSVGRVSLVGMLIGRLGSWIFRICSLIKGGVACCR